MNTDASSKGEIEESQFAEKITEKTRAMLRIASELQDVTSTVRDIREMLQGQQREHAAWKKTLFRILRESISLLFPDMGNHKR